MSDIFLPIANLDVLLHAFVSLLPALVYKYVLEVLCYSFT